jgi:hypothetical protein
MLRIAPHPRPMAVKLSTASPYILRRSFNNASIPSDIYKCRFYEVGSYPNCTYAHLLATLELLSLQDSSLPKHRLEPFDPLYLIGYTFLDTRNTLIPAEQPIAWPGFL